MSKGRFLNQKLGKRTSIKARLLKARLKVQRPPVRHGQTVNPADPKSRSS